MGIREMSKTKTQDGASFEKDLERLEKIVAALEEGGLPLEESLKQFEEGVALVRQCEKTLKAAERKIDMLVRGEAGEMEAVPFDESDADAAETATTAPPPAPTNAPPRNQPTANKANEPEEAPGEDGEDLLF
jgi:exodeoxyribonuclease VII small subunit